jgi:hypothetical protein
MKIIFAALIALAPFASHAAKFECHTSSTGTVYYQLDGEVVTDDLLASVTLVTLMGDAFVQLSSLKSVDANPQYQGFFTGFNQYDVTGDDSTYHYSFMYPKVATALDGKKFTAYLQIGGGEGAVAVATLACEQAWGDD